MDFKEHIDRKSRRSNSAPRNSAGSTEKEVRDEPKPPADLVSDGNYSIRSKNKRNFKSWLEEKKAKEGNKAVAPPSPTGPSTTTVPAPDQAAESDED